MTFKDDLILNRMHFKARLRNLSQVVCVCRNGERFKKGTQAMNDVNILANASVVVAHNGRIHAVDTEAALCAQEWYRTATFDTDLDLSGCALVPGLVDAHTHPVWCGDRVHEFEMKIQGATYMDVHKAGGGIGFTVRKTREGSKEELAALLRGRLDRMLRAGTTLIESGYGLDVETEIKMLRVLHESTHPVAIVATFLGAHSVPAGKTLAEATADVIERQLPAVIDLKRRGEISPECIDVFYEKGVFEREETKRILLAGKEAGLKINFHGDELHPMGAGELGADVGAKAISHLEEVSDEGIRQMAKHDIFGVLLPTTAYILRIQPPPARKLIDQGVPVALGSDFNPNAHCLSMPFVMNLACVLMRMTLNEALVACTINAAASLDRSDLHGSIEVGKIANFVLVRHPDWRHLIYELVDPPIHTVWVNGDCVHTTTVA